MSATRDRADNVLLTPRVIDQNAFDDLAGTLRGLIDQAEQAGRELDECVRQVGSEKADQRKSAEQLQERLRLSARMLKAFQSQIVRTESVIAEMTAREEKALAAQHQAEQAVEAVQERIGAAVEAAMDRFNQQLEDRMSTALERMDCEIDARAERLQRIAGDVDAMMPAIERLIEMAEGAEVTVSTMAHRAAILAVELDERSSEIKGLIELSGSASEQLDTGLMAAAQRIDEITEEGRSIADRLESARERGESANKRLSQEIEAALTASGRLAIDVRACEALETLLERLKPWEALVLERGDADADEEIELPEPAARLIDELRRRLDCNLDAFSSVLAHVAEQFQQFAGRDHVRREVRELDAREDHGGPDAIPAPDGGDEGVVSIIKPASPLSFSSHASMSRAE